MLIFVDGSCSVSTSGNRGGWGVAVQCGVQSFITRSGVEYFTTSNRMELTAVLEALKYISESDVKEKCIITSDSKYVVNGLNKWVEMWQNNGWKLKNGKPVKNQDLWHKILELNKKYDIEYVWTKAHAGNEGNELAHSLAYNKMKYGERNG